jgi:hypothetical protein
MRIILDVRSKKIIIKFKTAPQCISWSDSTINQLWPNGSTEACLDRDLPELYGPGIHLTFNCIVTLVL